MNNKQQRFYWLASAAGSLTLVFLLFFAPGLQAQDISSLEEDRMMRTFREVFDFIQDNYVDEVDSQVLMEGAMKGMFESLGDPYSAYLDATDWRNLTDTTSGEFGGVGLYINKVVPDDSRPDLQDWVEVVSPIEGTPAYRAGLRPRDLIVDIEGDSTVDMSIDEVVKRLRGEPGSDVTVTVQRGDRRFPVVLTRAVIEIPVVRYAGIEDNIGYVRVIQFTPRTADKVQEAVTDLKHQGFTDLIVDLRSNPGGLLSAAIDTADLFFDNGLVVGTAGRVESENQQFFAHRGKSVDDSAQVVVLVNDGTASAAEILSGALKDRDRAILVGETTFGKGSVQQVRQLGSLVPGGFRLTMARYYTPDHIFIDKVGINPDIEVKEPQLPDDVTEAAIQIQNDKRIDQFLSSVQDKPSERDIQNFIAQLKDEGFAINDRLMRRLITVELDIRTNVNPVYDLEYDLVLQQALDILKQHRVQAIIDQRPAVDVSNGDPSAGNLPAPALP